ncbi:MAG: hypothetical protein HW411_1545 [Gammaproteobacteria bacterium]|nr:hypothetical protein [Gammaproteobacteria bacterium]
MQVHVYVGILSQATGTVFVDHEYSGALKNGGS